MNLRRSDKPTGAPSGAPNESDREALLFDALASPDQSFVSVEALTRAWTTAGLRQDDPRIAASVDQLASLGKSELSWDDFSQVIKPSILLIERALTHRLAIPDFESFSAELEDIYQQVSSNRSGAVANYIPQLGRVDPEQFGVGLCTVDGQRASVGDAGTSFCLQSVSKFVSYAVALQTRGEERVHRHVGREPSGVSFNELALNPRGLPHNPMVNAGAIMCCALIQPGMATGDRFDYVLEMWSRLSGGTRPGFSNPTYLSERGTADRNFALGYFMREQGAFPEEVDLVETLEFYFQCCSLEMTVESLSVVAATFASGGICPLTGQRVLDPDTVQKCLSLMYSCGMYDYSGEWAFSVGLPAKSGVSGAIVVVIPNVAGFCTWSPRLDEHGNSVRGIEFSRELVRRFHFSNYDMGAFGNDAKRDPRFERESIRRKLIVELCYASAEGDLDGMRRLVAQGADPNHGDYDGRTPLHLAASEGQLEVVHYLLEKGARHDPVDRWGHTPETEARQAGHERLAELLGANP